MVFIALLYRFYRENRVLFFCKRLEKNEKKLNYQSDGVSSSNKGVKMTKTNIMGELVSTECYLSGIA